MQLISNWFINEAFRLLKKGGRLIIADYFTPAKLTGNDGGWYKNAEWLGRKRYTNT